MNYFGRVTFAVTCVLAAGGPALGQTVYSDGEFADLDWVVTPFIIGDATPGPVITVGSGGNPGAHRQIECSIGDTPDIDGIAVAQVFNAVVWDPQTDGEIFSLDCSVDFQSINLAPTVVGCAVEQDGEIFVAVIEYQAADPGWTPKIGLAMQASSFQSTLGTSDEPDFGPAGLPIHLGFVTGQSELFAGGHQLFQHGIDNWRIEINPIIAAIFSDGFEGGDTSEWSAVVP